jgi:hypothetical protein
MPGSPYEKRVPVQADPARRVLHTLIAIAGWVLFVYWWWLVFQRVNTTEVRYTLWSIVLALLVIVLVTALWALHNLMLYRRHGPRTKVREVPEDFSHDSVGRPVNMPMLPQECLTSGIVVVRIADGTKLYEPLASTETTPVPSRLKAQA